MQSLHVVTPTILSKPISKRIGRDVYLKLENFQPTQSFKIRGIGALCTEAYQSGAKLFVSSSGGNAGLAAAYAGNKLGVATIVYVPETTPSFMQNRIRDEGANVIVAGKSWDDANRAALEDVKSKNAFYISPFDHPTIWDGHATMIDELKTQMEKPSLIVTAVGGGGLLCGILEGLHRNDWKDVPVLGCETEGTASFAATLQNKKLVTLDGVSGVATSLGARMVTAGLLDWINRHEIRSAIVSDKAAVDACVSFLDDHKFLVEPACGAALSTLYGRSSVIDSSGSIAVIVCGGAVISFEKLNKLQVNSLN